MALLVAAAPSAQASGHLPSFNPFDCWPSATAVWLGLIFPSDAGLFVPASGAPEFDVGWSWQIPITFSCRGRLTGGVELLPTGPDLVRGRVGYRYARRYFLAGFGASFSGSGNSWSPEIGVQFAHGRIGSPPSEYGEKESENVAHLLVRGEFDSQFRGLTILLGWDVF